MFNTPKSNSDGLFIQLKWFDCVILKHNSEKPRWNINPRSPLEARSTTTIENEYCDHCNICQKFFENPSHNTARMRASFNEVSKLDCTDWIQNDFNIVKNKKKKKKKKKKDTLLIFVQVKNQRNVQHYHKHQVYGT